MFQIHSKPRTKLYTFNSLISFTLVQDYCQYPFKISWYTVLTPCFFTNAPHSFSISACTQSIPADFSFFNLPIALLNSSTRGCFLQALRCIQPKSIMLTFAFLSHFHSTIVRNTPFYQFSISCLFKSNTPFTRKGKKDQLWSIILFLILG